MRVRTFYCLEIRDISRNKQRRIRAVNKQNDNPKAK